MSHGWERATPVPLMGCVDRQEERHRSGALPAMSSAAIFTASSRRARASVLTGT